MKIGTLRHRIDLKNAVEQQDSYGEMTKTYSVYQTVWAMIEPLQGRELEHAKQVFGETTHKVRMRYNSKIEHTHRIGFGSREFEIISIVNPDEKSIEHVLICKEIA